MRCGGGGSRGRQGKGRGSGGATVMGRCMHAWLARMATVPTSMRAPAASSSPAPPERGPRTEPGAAWAEGANRWQQSTRCVDANGLHHPHVDACEAPSHCWGTPSGMDGSKVAEGQRLPHRAACGRPMCPAQRPRAARSPPSGAKKRHGCRRSRPHALALLPQTHATVMYGPMPCVR